ncbi:MAG: hypothetical protein E7624_01040 [Ruminococcaceae bacterium]|nr:hypothetical protein [Oscillospiraceae bacterium]
MPYTDMRKELSEFYFAGTGERGEEFRVRANAEMDRRYREGMNPYEMKVLQYRVIADMFEPVLFYTSPYYYETGTMWAHCDGGRDFRGFCHAGGWTYWKNEHLFRDQDPALWELSQKQRDELFYTVCGAYNDDMQHFNFDNRPILKGGLKGIYERAEVELASAKDDEERAYLQATMEAMLTLKKMSEKFADKAEKLLKNAPDEAARKNLALISKTARRCPWEAPQTLYEALNTFCFMRKCMGALEGIGPNTFGRIDMDLAPFYDKEIAAGTLTKAAAYDLVCKFLLTWDLHFDHDFKFAGYSDHELENTYVLGGCDADGKPFCHDLTLMFLRASREETIIFPKITCRYGKNSPKEYLDEANLAVINGTSTLLYQNDDATIPSILRRGKPIEEARDYLITGCWGIMSNGKEKIDDGCYVNILKVLEYMLHNRTDKMREVGMTFAPVDGASSFEELYRIYCDNILVLFEERARVVRLGGNVWNKVDPLPIFSSTMEDCIGKHKDYTAGGAKYRDSRYELIGYPNVVDSLLAIKKLCFDERKYTLAEMLDAIRHNWEGYEDMRIEAMRAPGWGMGNKDADAFCARFNTDLYEMAQKQVGTYGGKIVIGHLAYTEIRWWGEKTLATPEGRKNGDYIAQGLTPSRLKKIPAVTSVIQSFSALDASEIGGNSVVNVILPNKTTLAHCEAFLRATADSAVQSLQVNCTSREQLLDAQKHPEKYPTLIVRMCGFSAKFTSLSPEWQQEVLTRNFYE